jgi:hypothetical protein
MLVPTAEQYRREEHGGRTGHRRHRGERHPGSFRRARRARLALAATPGQGSILVLRGEPGVGKSALLDDVARQTREVGWRLLRTGGTPGPTVVVHDDAHWLDRSSVEVLAFVARRLAPELPRAG